VFILAMHKLTREDVSGHCATLKEIDLKRDSQLKLVASCFGVSVSKLRWGDRSCVY